MFKSKTINFSYLLTVFGILELNMPLIREQLGENYGYLFIAVSIIVGLLRQATTKPLSER